MPSMFWAWIGNGALLLLVTTRCCCDALGSGYVHDDTTTYCWRIPQPVNVQLPTFDPNTVLQGQSGGCPLWMNIQAPANAQVNEFLTVNWSLGVVRTTLDGNNAINHHRISDLMDKNTNKQVNIVHSNVHSCAFGSNCDPFQKGNDFVDNTPNQVASFVGDRASFTSRNELVFSKPGIYTVLAHVILPGDNEQERFDYAVYHRLNVEDKDSDLDHHKSGSGSGIMSTTMWLLAGCLAALLVCGCILFIVLCKRRRCSKRGQAEEIFLQHNANCDLEQPMPPTSNQSTATSHSNKSQTSSGNMIRMHTSCFASTLSPRRPNDDNDTSFSNMYMPMQAMPGSTQSTPSSTSSAERYSSNLRTAETRGRQGPRDRVPPHFGGPFAQTAFSSGTSSQMFVDDDSFLTNDSYAYVMEDSFASSRVFNDQHSIRSQHPDLSSKSSLTRTELEFMSTDEFDPERIRKINIEL